jgi:phosphoribosylanthranilate isomerase
MSREDIDICSRAGADAVGFVTEYPVEVPWNISRDKARKLVAATPPFMKTTAVVGGSVETILKLAEIVKPDLLQLHGDESIEEIEQICLSLQNTATKVIKALRIDVETGKAKFSIEDPLEAVKILTQTGIAALAVDSKTANRPAGTGVTLDWGVISEMRPSLSIPLILAGGLTVQNVSAAIEQVQPYGVDIISGVEKKPGLKDESLVTQFVRTVKQSPKE